MPSSIGASRASWRLAWTRLLGSHLGESGGAAELQAALTGYARTAQAHGLGDAWETIVVPRLADLSREIADRLERRRA